MPYILVQNVDAHEPLTAPTKKVDFHQLIPAHILEGYNTFCTKSFLVRYCEEEVPLNCIVQFRALLGDSAKDLGTPFFLEAELLFSDLSNLSGPKRIIGLSAKQETVPVDFHVVSKQTFKILNAARGTCFAYIPLTFDELHFTRTRVILHSAVLDLPLSTPESTNSATNSACTTNPLIPTKGPNGAFGAGWGSVSETDIEGIFKGSVATLVEVYEGLRRRYVAIKGLYQAEGEVQKVGLVPEVRSYTHKAWNSGSTC